MSSFDLESLIHLEQSFYDTGYTDGFAHGRIHGLIEGRALGREKGYEMWEELGFYEGFAMMWQAVYEAQGKEDDRAFHHIKHLLLLISQFPRVNPSSDSSSDLDIPKLFRQIRSRYKALCSSLGVRPSLRSFAESSTEPGATQDLGVEGELDSVAVAAQANANGNQKASVWTLERSEGLSY